MSFNSLEDLVTRAAEGVRPPKRMSVWEAAEEYRYINNVGSYVGPYDANITPYMKEPAEILTSLSHRAMIFAAPAQCGKALALDTPIPTPTGWVNMGDLKEGDEVLDERGEPCSVTFVTPTQHGRECYKVNFTDGPPIIADADHNWYAQRSGAKFGVFNTKSIYDSQKTLTGRSAWRIPRNDFLKLSRKNFGISPYVLGTWLGDGHKYGPRIYTSAEDAPEMAGNIELAGVETRTRIELEGVETRTRIDKKRLAVIALSREPHNPGRAGGRNGFSLQLQKYGMGAGEAKYIPEAFLRGAVEQRYALLQGLMDTDGSCDKVGRCEFGTMLESIAAPFCELLTTLGFRWTCRKIESGFHRITFTPPANSRVFRLSRKQARLDTVRGKRKSAHLKYATIASVEKVPSVPVRCITVDSPNSLYLAGEGMNVTHNTDLFPSWLTHSVICDPSDIMLIQTTQATARDFSIRRIQEGRASLLKNAEEVAARLVKHRNAQNTYDIRFSSGMMVNFSWPTINELSGRPIPRLFLTDYDRMDQNVDGEGSPFKLAQARATTFRRHGMTVAESSPGFMHTDTQWVRSSPHEAPPVQGILGLYNTGDRRRYYWKCVSCKVPFEPAWELITYPLSDDIMESAEQAVMNCPHCGQIYNHDSREVPGKEEMNQRHEDGGHARWLKEGSIWMPNGEIGGTPIRSETASFWLQGVCATFNNWTNLVSGYLSAKATYESTGAEEDLKAHVNTKLGLAYTPMAQASARVAETLRGRSKDLGHKVVPYKVRFLVATVDVQKNKFVVQVHGFGSNNDIYIVDRYDVKYSRRPQEDRPDQLCYINAASHPEDWRILLDEVMLKTYPLADDSGAEMAIKMTFCDSGGRAGVTKNAYDFFRWLRKGHDEQASDEDLERYPHLPGMDPRFQLVKGDPKPASPRVRISYPDSQRKDRRAGARGEIPVMMMNSNMMKNTLDAVLDRTEIGGRINFPNWLHINFYKELCVETKNKEGKWENLNNYRNESWDLLYYALAGVLHPDIKIEYIDWDAPPSWASVWEDNDLVFYPEEDNKPFVNESKTSYGLGDLAKQLA